MPQTTKPSRQFGLGNLPAQQGAAPPLPPGMAARGLSFAPGQAGMIPQGFAPQAGAMTAAGTPAIMGPPPGQGPPPNLAAAQAFSLGGRTPVAGQRAAAGPQFDRDRLAALLASRPTTASWMR